MFPNRGGLKTKHLVVISCAGSKNHSIFTAFHFSQIILFPVVAMFSIKHDSYFEKNRDFKRCHNKRSVFVIQNDNTTFLHFEWPLHPKSNSATVTQLSRPCFRCYLILHILHWFSTLTCLSSTWDNKGWLDSV